MGLTKFFIRLFVFFINPGIKITVMDIGDTEYNIEEDRIYFSFDDKWDIGLTRHLKECHHFYDDYSILTIGLLHEIGHYFTLDTFLLNWEQRYNLETKPLHRIFQSKRLQDKYYNLPEEFAATEWAIEYIKEHPRRCKLLDKVLRNI